MLFAQILRKVFETEAGGHVMYTLSQYILSANPA